MKGRVFVSSCSSRAAAAAAAATDHNENGGGNDGGGSCRTNGDGAPSSNHGNFGSRNSSARTRSRRSQKRSQRDGSETGGDRAFSSVSTTVAAQHYGMSGDSYGLH